MTDYFALLEQPRRPWLDPEKLKQAFHEKARSAHPDAQQPEAGIGRADESGFAEINEAYQVLLSPKRRLHHLLSLCGDPPVAGATVPREIEERFLAVATLSQETEAVVRKLSAATTPLSRSLVQPEMLDAQNRIGAVLEDLRRLEHQAVAELQRVSESWNGAETNSSLQYLYLRFAYLDRWTAELQEKRTQLTL